MSPDKPPPPPPGLVIVDKDRGPTSHDVVGKLRRIMGTRKVGHAGTLDPMATGVLVVGIERATKLLGHLSLDTKTYTATVRLGQATTTDDAEGDPLGDPTTVETGEEAIRTAMAELTGDIEQVPSAVSAVKVDGRRAYRRVRDGETVEIPARPVTVSSFDLLAVRGAGEFLDLDVDVDCTSGTYVRALARDLGAALGVGGHLTALRRTRVGPFTIEQSRTVDQLTAAPGLSLDLAAAVAAAFPRRQLDETEATAVRFGQSLPVAGIAGNYGAFAPDGTALALMVDRGDVARPVVVFAPAG